MLTHLSLFTGVGGMDIAAEWAGFQTAGQCEWADYQTNILEKHWPDVPRWRDIKTLTREGFYERTGLRTVDVISGGFPCQPFSVAGKRKGKDDDRYLWPEMLRVISEIRPTWVFGENVAGIVNMELDQVLADLESQGYACQAFVIPACAVDAPHRRDRCAIVAYRSEPRGGRLSVYQRGSFKTDADIERSRETMADSMRHRSPARTANSTRWEKGQATKPFDDSKVMANADIDGCCGIGCEFAKGCNTNKISTLVAESKDVSDADVDGFQKSRQEPEQQEISEGNGAEFSSWRPAQPGLGGVADGPAHWLDEPLDIHRVAIGIPNRVDRLKALGNMVVPQWAYPIFNAIARIEALMKEGNDEQHHPTQP